MEFMPPVVVGDGDVTILSRLASFTWGRYSVSWPEDFDAPELAPDRELGFVAKLPAPEGGRFSRRFVRADAQIDAVNGYSDVESVLDEAEERTGGDVFFERDVSSAGLGRLVPYVHFTIGDVIPVRIWGRIIRLPVTSIEEVSEQGEHVGWRVHVGGQLISDRRALDEDTEALRRVVAQERRERVAGDAAVRGVAEDARWSASEAVSKADDARGVADVVRAATTELTLDLTGDEDGSVPEAVERREGALGGIQASVDRAQSMQLVLHDNQLKWLGWTKPVFDYTFTVESGSDGASNYLETGMVDMHLNTRNGTGADMITRPGWKGVAEIQWTDTAGVGGLTMHRADGHERAYVFHIMEGVKVQVLRLSVWPEWGTDPREWVVRVAHNSGGEPELAATELGHGALVMAGSPESIGAGGVRFGVGVMASSDVLVDGVVVESGQVIPAGSGIYPPPEAEESVVVFTEDKAELIWEPGAPLNGRQPFSIARRTLSRNVWTTLQSWRGPDWPSARDGHIVFSLTWNAYNSWAFANYQTRILKNGQEIGSVSRSTTFGMDTFFRIEVDTKMEEGDLFQFQAAANPGFTNERVVRSGNIEITWS